MNKPETQSGGLLKPVGSEIDVEVVISPQPRGGVSRHIGGVHPGTMKDDKAIAAALRKIADTLSPNAA